jgi:hypothetical protein
LPIDVGCSGCSDAKKDRAIGEWLDMYGNRWKRNREGGWTLIEGR